MDTLRFLDYGIYFIDGKSPGGVGALSYYPDSMNGLDRGFRDAVVFGNPEFEKIVGNQSIGFVTYEAESLFFIVQQRRENEFDPRSGAPRPFQQYRYILISNEELQESYEKGREIFFEIINQHPKKMQDDPFILPTYEQAGGLLHPEPVFKPKELSSSPMLRLRSIKIKNKILAIVNEISQYPDHQIRVLDDQVPLVEKLFIAQEGKSVV